MSLFREMIAVAAGMGLAVSGCGTDSSDLVAGEFEFMSMLSGESCTPDADTFQQRDRDQSGEASGEPCEGECDAGDGEQTQTQTQNLTGEQTQQQDGAKTQQPAGTQTQQPDGTQTQQQDGTQTQQQDGTQTQQQDGTQTQQQDGTQTKTQQQEGTETRQQAGEECGLYTYHRDDFPQPGCDDEGCCQIRAEEAEELQNREQIQCRCRARLDGEDDTSSLPECCAERPDRQCETDDDLG